MTSGKNWWVGIADVLLWIAAVSGLVSIGLVIASFGFGISLIMFKTGSMSPAIPAGSLAIEREIQASEIHVGDVMTIDRQNQLPISHRVTSVSPDQGEFRAITMRGDANSIDDPIVYVVDHGRIVLFSAPGLSGVVVWLSHPLVHGVLAIGAAGLVLWAFWPRTERRKRKHLAEEGEGASENRGAEATTYDEAMVRQ